MTLWGSKERKIKRKGSVIKRIGQKTGAGALFLMQKGVCLLPPGGVRVLGRMGGGLLFVLLRRKRFLTIQNLQRVLDLPEARSLARQNFRNLALILPEMFKFYHLPPEEIRNRIHVEGLEYLEEARSRGNGTICVSAHLGNFLLIPLRLFQEGYPFTLLVRAEKNSHVEKIFIRLRQQSGIKTLYRGQSYFPLAKALKRNEILWLFVDQFPRRSELTIPFLGFPFPIYTGHARLARMTGATVLPITISRLEKERIHRVTIFPPFKTDEYSPLNGGSPEEERNLLDALQTPLHAIEELIRLRPAEWLWWHKDWFRSKAVKVGKEDRVSSQPEDKDAKKRR